MLAGVDEIGVSQVLDDRLWIDQRSQRVQPFGGIVPAVLLEQGVDPVPIPLEQTVDQAETGGEPRDGLGAGQGPGQVDCHAEVFGAKE